jgi:hypothetical protein
MRGDASNGTGGGQTRTADGRFLSRSRRNRLGIKQLLGCERDHHPNDNLDFVTIRSQALLSDFGICFRCGSRFVWRRSLAHSDDGLSPAAEQQQARIGALALEFV